VSTLENLSLTSAEQKTNRMRGWMGSAYRGRVVWTGSGIPIHRMSRKMSL
jgi:hypothetical protein